MITLFANVGVYHNEGLDSIYAKLSRFKVQRVNATDSFGTTKFELFNLYHQYTVDYVAQKWELSSSEQKMLMTHFTTVDEDFFKNDSPSYTIYYLERNLGVSFSDTFKNLVDSIFVIGDNSSLSYPAKTLAWNNLIDNHISDLSTFTEKAGFICGVRTAISTYNYWQMTSNQTKWTLLMDDAKQASKTTAMNGAWKDYIWGAIGGAAQYGVEGFGVMGVHGAIAGGVCGAVAGACMGTAGSVIKARVGNWLGW